MKHKKSILLLAFLLSSHLYFGQCDDMIVKILKGVWVKNTGAADTIRFSMIKGLDHDFDLILAGLPRPQGGPAGLYEFRTLGTTMLVRWLPSSNSGADALAFFLDRSQRTLTIGNFYHANKEGKLLTFRKLR